jgi:hypothetical protein
VSQASNVKHALALIGDSIPPLTPKTSATAQGRSEKRHAYKPLPTQFRRDRFSYRQIAREGDAAIYEQTWSGCSNPSVCYEVIRIRRREGFQIGSRFVEPAEVYPASEVWGVDGFTFTNRDKAWAKFFEILLEEPARRRRRKEVNLKWENPSGSSSATLST